MNEERTRARVLPAAGAILAAALMVLVACASPVASGGGGEPTYADDLAWFTQAVSGVTPPTADSDATEIFAYAITVETLAGVYGILPGDVVAVVTDQVADEGVRSAVLGVLDGSLSLIDLMVAGTGAYRNEEQQIVLGLPLQEEIPASSPIQTNGTPEIVDDGQRVGMRFDAPEDYLLIPADPSNDLTHDGTIELWLKPVTNVAWAGIVHKGTAADWSDEGYSLQYDGSSRLMLALTSEAGQSVLVWTQHVPAAGEWSHLVATWDADEVHIYVNGVDVVSKITAGFSSTPTTMGENYPLRSSGGDVVVGTQVPGYAWRFDGVMSDIRIYNRCMPPSEVLEHLGQ